MPGLSRLLEAPVGRRPLVCFHSHAPVSCVWTVVPKAPPGASPPGVQVWGFRGAAFSLSELPTACQAPRPGGSSTWGLGLLGPQPLPPYFCRSAPRPSLCPRSPAYLHPLGCQPPAATSPAPTRPPGLLPCIIFWQPRLPQSLLLVSGTCSRFRGGGPPAPVLPKAGPAQRDGSRLCKASPLRKRQKQA